jgi:hypothetical protein
MSIIGSNQNPDAGGRWLARVVTVPEEQFCLLWPVLLVAVLRPRLRDSVVRS